MQRIIKVTSTPESLRDLETRLRKGEPFLLVDESSRCMIGIYDSVCVFTDWAQIKTDAAAYVYRKDTPYQNGLELSTPDRIECIRLIEVLRGSGRFRAVLLQQHLDTMGFEKDQKYSFVRSYFGVQGVAQGVRDELGFDND